MWLYGVGTMPFLKGIRDILGEEGLLAFYADDGNLFAPFEKMVEFVEYVRREGPKYGFSIKAKQREISPW
jgi:hypothetical protein